MVRERLQAGTLGRCQGPYRNPWFLVKKSTPGKYRMVNVAMMMNKVTLRDASLPPRLEEFAEEFAGMTTVSLLDLFSGYDQIELDKASRDLTAFMTPLGLMRSCTLPQGATNSVAQFCRILELILAELLPSIARAFLDDIGIKGAFGTYDDEEVLPGVRRYVLEHILNIDKVLVNCEYANA